MKIGVELQAHRRVPEATNMAKTMLRVGFAGVVCGAMIYGGSAMAQDADAAPPAKPKKIAHAAHPKKVAKATYAGSKGPVYKGEPAVAAAAPACGEVTAYMANGKLGIKGWVIPAPSFADSVLQDIGCWRSNLAKYGIGFITTGAFVYTDNMLNHYTPGSSNQQYNGQKSTPGNSVNAHLTYDLSQYGLPDGQFGIEFDKANTTDAPNYGQNQTRMGELKIYGTALDKKLEYEVGYLQNQLRFQGTFVGGSVTNPLGPQSGSAELVGETYAPAGQPTVSLKYHFTDSWYDHFAIARPTPGSIDTSPGGLPNLPPPLGSNNLYQGNPFAVEAANNKSGFNFALSTPCVNGICYHSPRELFIDEIGYQTPLGANGLSTWVRLTGYFNNTSTYNYLAGAQTGSTTATTNNYAVSLYADQQIWQMEPGSPFTNYKGLYVGGTVAYDDPKADAFQYDFEARVYTFGLFGRPRDQIAVSYQHQTVSPYITDPGAYAITPAAQAAAATTTATCTLGLVCTRHAINTYALTYTANINRGIYATLGVEYIDHPNLAYSPYAQKYGSNAAPPFFGVVPVAPLGINHALDLVASIYYIF